MTQTENSSSVAQKFGLSFKRVAVAIVTLVLCFSAARLIDLYHGSIEGDRIIAAVNGSVPQKALVLGFVQAQLSTWIRVLSVVVAVLIVCAPAIRVAKR